MPLDAGIPHDARKAGAEGCAGGVFADLCADTKQGSLGIAGADTRPHSDEVPGVQGTAGSWNVINTSQFDECWGFLNADEP